MYAWIFKTTLAFCFSCWVKFENAIYAQQRFRNILGKGVILSQNPTEVFTCQNSLIECAMKCESSPVCEAFNLRSYNTTTGVKMCELFKSKETDIFNQIKIEIGSTYFEKICSNPKKVAVASSNNQNASHYKVRISFSKDEENTYKITIPKTFQISSSLVNYLVVFPFWSGIVNETADVESKVLSKYGGTIKKWYMKGNNVICFHNGYQLCSPWSSEHPLMSFESLVGSAWDGSMFDAFMTKDSDFDGFIAFCGEYVADIDIDPSNFTHWTLHPKQLIRTHPVWGGAPVDIMAAAWISRELDRSVDQSYAVLFTDMHMYIYSTSASAVIYRSQICNES